MPIKTLKAAITAALLAVASHSPAAHVTLPTPPASACCDTESSAVVPIHDWSEIGRRVNLSLAAQATPSNNVQVAFGKDTNGDEDLEPEEVQLVVGFDCGVWFVRDERPTSIPNLVTEDWTEDEHSTPSNVVKTIRLRQAVAATNRFDLAKVTVRGKGETAAEIVAEFYRRGSVISLQ